MPHQIGIGKWLDKSDEGNQESKKDDQTILVPVNPYSNPGTHHANIIFHDSICI